MISFICIMRRQRGKQSSRSEVGVGVDYRRAAKVADLNLFGWNRSVNAIGRRWSEVSIKNGIDCNILIKPLLRNFWVLPHLSFLIFKATFLP